MQSILNLTLPELENFILENKYPKYRAKQILTEIFQNRRFDFAEMTTLPADLRTKLSENFRITDIVHADETLDNDGTIKYLFRMHERKSIESVLIPQRESDNVTLCISTQEGCKMNCRFCGTGKLGFKSNLTVGEILSQYLVSEHLSGKKISNIVFMGMGEPLDNYQVVERVLQILLKEQKLLGRNRITVSTAGFADKIRRLADSGLGVKIALSLHSPQQRRRENIMPAAASNKLSDLIPALEYYYQKTSQPITFEYILFRNFNDTEEDLRHLKKITSHFPSKINLIQYHEIDFTGFETNLTPASTKEIFTFAIELKKLGINVFTRISAGNSIKAACGQLALASDKKPAKKK